MAKRRRLSPLTPAAAEAAAAAPPAPAARPAPIAQVAGDIAARAAFDAVAGELARARAEGRMVLALPLGAVDPAYLVRDRLAAAEEDLAPLVESLRARGQQTPVEVAALGAGRYGLISGWRRMTALARLHAETGEARFASVLALVRQPADAAEAYVAMVEENEIRAGLSHYERARIVARAAAAGVFPDERAALSALFAHATRPRRSKIGSFLAVVRALDGALGWPAAIGERLGLALARALEADPGLGRRLAAALAADPPADAAAEQARLAAALAPAAPPASAPPTPAPLAPPAHAPGPDARAAGPGAADGEAAPGIRLQAGPGRLTLSGPGVDAAFRARLAAWLQRGAP
jgi:ParB-like chromosome segregation protein Spo0J